MSKKIGILTGGGDCPGLNAVIRGVVKSAIIRHGWEVIGIEDGFDGLLDLNKCRSLTMESVRGILPRGGTILGTTNRGNPFSYPVEHDGNVVVTDLSDKVVDNIRTLGLDALIAVGGEGSLKIALELANKGVPVVGVPKTIDNDLRGTDVTFGYNTALETATDALDKLHTTAESHHRVMIMEVMGRYAGWIALESGIAGSADVILIPEIPFDIEKVAQRCVARSKVGKRFTIIAAGEGAAPAGGQRFVSKVDESSPDPIRLGGVAKFLADEVEKRTGLEGRYVVLGHVQRGGTPTPHDRVLATAFGHHAFELLCAGAFSRLVVRQQGRITDIPIAEAAGKVRTVPPDHPLVRAARAIGTSFGD
jgi:phosphofructokinase-like protein